MARAENKRRCPRCVWSEGRRSGPLAIVLGICLGAPLALLPPMAAPQEQGGFVQDWLTRARQGASRIYESGRTDAYLSGAYWHLPFAYSHDRRKELNAHAWGLGLGRSIVDARDNEEMLLAVASQSSHFKPQYFAGYAWLARWRIAGDLRVGAGYLAFVFARSDIYHYLPLPGFVPLASVGTDRASLVAGYLPAIATGITGRGNVVYALGRIAFD